MLTTACSPKLNGGVERINQTWRTLVYNFRDDLPENILQLSDFVKDYQHYYNFERPHKALDFLPPFSYFFNISSVPNESHML
ncbi:MAG: integrase core domain-containing protein [Alphaproteobacteria bacterium]|nr:integrase core domain-containing protein [Alphaproteobacteria bacterium]